MGYKPSIGKRKHRRLIDHLLEMLDDLEEQHLGLRKYLVEQLPADPPQTPAEWLEYFKHVNPAFSNLQDLRMRMQQEARECKALMEDAPDNRGCRQM